jgi:hypothetical protein
MRRLTPDGTLNEKKLLKGKVGFKVRLLILEMFGLIQFMIMMKLLIYFIEKEMLAGKH